MPEIDLILGGHDHDFFYNCGKNSLVLKSGTDFRELTYNKLKLCKLPNDSGINESVFNKISDNKFISVINKGLYKLNIETDYLQITQHLAEDETVKKFVNLLEAKTEEKFKQVIGHLASTVDVRFSMVRTQSLPISNFISDIVNIFMDTDVTIINSGTLRIDSIIDEGDLKYLNL